MNKNIAIVVIAVILLGMGLISYNEYVNPVKPIPHTTKKVEDSTEMNTPESNQIPQASVNTLPLMNSTPANQETNNTNTPALAEKVPPKEAPLVQSQNPKPQTKPSPIAPAQKGKVEPKKNTPQPTAIPTPPIAKQHVTNTPESKNTNTSASTTPVTVSQEDANKNAIEQALAQSREKSTLPSSVKQNAPTISQPVTPPTPVAPAAPVKQSVVSKQQTTVVTEKIIKKISVLPIGDGVTVRLDSNQMPKYRIMRLNSPERLVLDLLGQWKLRAPGVPNNKLVSNIRIGHHKEGTRIVIDLKQVPASIRYLKYGITGLDVRIK